MEAIFLQLLNMSITAGWLVLAVLLLRLALKNAPKSIRCALWALVGIRLMLPFSLESVWSLIPSAEPIPMESLQAGTLTVDTGIAVLDEAVNPVLAETFTPVISGTAPGAVSGAAQSAVSSAVQTAAPTAVSITQIASVIWLIGMAAMLIHTAVSYLRLRRRVAASIPTGDGPWLCDGIETPFILGIFRPRIYIPSAMPEEQVVHVVAHERAHLRRRDHWWKPLGFLLLTIHWFNPLLWAAYVLLCRDIELACDEKVIRDMDAEEKKAYSIALLESSIPRRMIAACPLAFGEVGVKARIRSVLNYKKPTFWLAAAAVVVCVIAAVCLLTDPPVQDATLMGSEYKVSKVLYATQEHSTDPADYPEFCFTADQYLYVKDGGEWVLVDDIRANHLAPERFLEDYMQYEDGWTGSKYIPDIADAWYFQTDDQVFYMIMQTKNGQTLLAGGWEDVSERNDAGSDDAAIHYLCLLERQLEGGTISDEFISLSLQHRAGSDAIPFDYWSDVRKPGYCVVGFLSGEGAQQADKPGMGFAVFRTDDNGGYLLESCQAYPGAAKSASGIVMGSPAAVLGTKATDANSYDVILSANKDLLYVKRTFYKDDEQLGQDRYTADGGYSLLMLPWSEPASKYASAYREANRVSLLFVNKDGNRIDPDTGEVTSLNNGLTPVIESGMALYSGGEWTAAVPAGYADRLEVVSFAKDAYGYTPLSFADKATTALSEYKYGVDAAHHYNGYLFSIQVMEQDAYAAFLEEPSSGNYSYTLFAKDDRDRRYFLVHDNCHVISSINPQGKADFAELFALREAVRKDFITRNGLTPCTEAEILEKLPLTLSLNKQSYITRIGDAPVQLWVEKWTAAYTWVSSDPDIASVDADGKVTAVSCGTVQIYATDGTSIGKCTISVMDRNTPSMDITVLYDCGEWTAVLPGQYADQLVVEPGSGKAAFPGNYPILNVYEAASLEDAEKDFGSSEGFGFLFGIFMLEADAYEEWLLYDIPGAALFARDDAGRYFFRCEATDVQYYRSDIKTNEYAVWESLMAMIEPVCADFIARNGLTSYTAAEANRDYDYSLPVSDPGDTPVIRDGLALYSYGEWTAALPAEYADDLIVKSTYGNGNAWAGKNLLDVYEKVSSAVGEKLHGEFGYGDLFSIRILDQADLEEYLTSEGSGTRLFAKDGKNRYYLLMSPTDWSIVRSSGVVHADDARLWNELYALNEQLCTDFITRNDLTPYTLSDALAEYSAPASAGSIQWADPVVKHIISTAYLETSVQEELEKKINLGPLTYSTETFWEYVELVDAYMEEHDITVPQIFLDNIKSFSFTAHPDYMQIALSYYNEDLVESRGICSNMPPWITLRSLADFTHMQNLESLRVHETTVTDLTPVQSLRKLKAFGVNCDCLPVLNLDAIGQMTDLTELYLSGLDHHNMNFLSSLHSLKKLYLFECENVELASMARSLPSTVTTLRMPGCNLLSIKALADLTQLTYLELNRNLISDVSPLAGLTNLTYLCLSDNEITDITPLAGLTQLETIDLENNLLTDITALKSMTGLKDVNVSWNQIFDLSPLESLPALESLHTTGNPAEIRVTAGVNNGAAPEKEYNLPAGVVDKRTWDYEADIQKLAAWPEENIDVYGLYDPWHSSVLIVWDGVSRCFEMSFANTGGLAFQSCVMDVDDDGENELVVITQPGTGTGTAVDMIRVFEMTHEGIMMYSLDSGNYLDAMRISVDARIDPAARTIQAGGTILPLPLGLDLTDFALGNHIGFTVENGVIRGSWGIQFAREGTASPAASDHTVYLSANIHVSGRTFTLDNFQISSGLPF